MGVIRGLLTGFGIAGAATIAYNQQIYSTSDTLRRALTNLSRDLDGLRIQSKVEEIPTAPQPWSKLSLGEQIKVQWNDQLMRGMHALYTTRWGEVAQDAWTRAKVEAMAVQSRLSQ